MTGDDIPGMVDPRVQIAMDVLAQLDARRLFACAGIYLDIVPYVPAIGLVEPEADLREILSGRTCDVCALGSLFVAKLDRQNAFTWGDMDGTMNNDDPMRRYLGAEFSPRELALIEAAFEGRWILSQLPDSVEGLDILQVYGGCVDCAHNVEYPTDPRDCYSCDARPTEQFRAALKFRKRYQIGPEFDAEGCLRGIMQNIIANGGEFRP